jgi:hypothetical protein
VVFTDGFVRGRKKRAIESLHTFWRRVCEGALVPMSVAKALSPIKTAWDMDGTLGFQMFDAITRMFSPYPAQPARHPIRCATS